MSAGTPDYTLERDKFGLGDKQEVLCENKCGPQHRRIRCLTKNNNKSLLFRDKKKEDLLDY